MKILQPIFSPTFSNQQFEVSILRLDLLNEAWNGNKFFKLKYHLEDAKNEGCKTIASFGGPWSNHLAALATYGKSKSLQTIGYVRFQGEIKNHPTLIAAKENGMQLHFLSNKEYDFLQEKIKINCIENDTYFIPSGGHTLLGVKGCEEILQLDELKNVHQNFTHIFVPVGNGTTLAGIVNAALSTQKINGIVSVKNGEYLQDEIENFTKQKNWQLLFNYHFGGLGKKNIELENFMQNFKTIHGIELDRVYTSKMMFAIEDLLQQNYFKKDSKILAIHTGGLQGNANVSNKK